MQFERIRQSFKPLFGLGHRDTVVKLLTYILYAALGVNGIFTVVYLAAGGVLLRAPGIVYASLLLLHILLLWVLKKGYVDQAALAFVFSVWAGLTYQAWAEGGVRDTAILIYILLIMVSALITSWRVALVVTVLSVLAVWGLAILEIMGFLHTTPATPVVVASELTVVFGLVILFTILIVDALSRSVQAVQAGEEKFHKIFNATPVAVMITTLQEGRLLDANEAFWTLTGFDPETSRQRTVVELGLWDNVDTRRHFIARLLERKSLRNSDYEFTNRHGERHSTIALYELINLGDEPTILTMLYDMTEQRKAEQALRLSEERFRRVFNVSPVAIVVTTLDEGRLIDANEAFWKLSGHDPKTSIGRTTFELRDVLDPAIRERFVQELLENKSIQNPAYDFVNEQGGHLKTVAFYELIDVNEKPAILSMFYDITEQSQARDALQHSELRFRAMLEAVPDMVFEMKRDGSIVHFSPSAINELNFVPETMIGRNIAAVLPRIAEQVAFAVGRALESGQVHAFEFQVTVGVENKTFEARVSPAGADLVLIMVRDVSLNKWSESERENLIGELEQKNAELERFTYTVSHDLKSPLITIKGFLGFVREDAKAGDLERLEKDIQRIGGATEKMQRLLGDLLELSRVGRLKNKPELIASNALIAEVIELVQGRITAGQISVKVAEDLPDIFGDRQRIFEVFQNLIDNAAKFMGDRPRPSIEIGAQGLWNNMPVFFVRDNGIGISPQFKERIFGLFDKLDAQSEGTGIGLALVKRIVEFHGGRIWVESDIDKGATFFFALPSQPLPGT